jgi:hypothetical protein
VSSVRRAFLLPLPFVNASELSVRGLHAPGMYFPAFPSALRRFRQDARFNKVVWGRETVEDIVLLRLWRPVYVRRLFISSERISFQVNRYDVSFGNTFTEVVTTTWSTPNFLYESPRETTARLCECMLWDSGPKGMPELFLSRLSRYFSYCYPDPRTLLYHASPVHVHLQSYFVELSSSSFKDAFFLWRLRLVLSPRNPLNSLQTFRLIAAKREGLGFGMDFIRALVSNESVSQQVPSHQPTTDVSRHYPIPLVVVNQIIAYLCAVIVAWYHGIVAIAE